MQKHQRKEHIQVQVGAFIASGLLLVMLAVFMLGSKTTLFQTYYSLVCYFDDISGLRVGAPVQLAGINVGFIDDISFEDRTVSVHSSDLNPQENEATAETPDKKEVSIVKVRVMIKIDKRYQNRIRSDSVASVVTQGLLGDRMIGITVGSRERSVLHDGDILIEVKDPTGFTHLVEKGDVLIQEAQSLVKNTDELMKKLNIVVAEVIDGDGLAHSLFFEDQDTRLMADFSESLRNLRQMSQGFASVAQKIDGGQGTIGALINDESLFNDLKTLMGKANRNKLIRSVIRYTLQNKEKEQLK